MGVEMTWVDCFFFATVVSTTVGYGILTPQSTGAKIFCTVYFFVASTIVGSFITDFSGVLAFRTKKNIYAKVINSTVIITSIATILRFALQPNIEAQLAKMTSRCGSTKLIFTKLVLYFSPTTVSCFLMGSSG